MTLKKWLLSASLVSATALEVRLLSYAPLQLPGLPQNPGVAAVSGNCPPDFPKVCASYKSFSGFSEYSVSSGQLFCCATDEACCPNGCGVAGTFCCGDFHSCVVGDFCCEGNACCSPGGQCCSESQLCCPPGELCCPGGQWCYQPGVSQCP